MKIEILGCSGSIMQGYNTTSILVNSRILIDAGSVVSVLPESMLKEIASVLITHPHIDHIKELPFLVDALFASHTHGIRIMGSQRTIEALKVHVFNGLIWPDLAELDVDKSFLSLECIPHGWFVLNGIQVKAFTENHIEGSVGYVIGEEGRYALFTGDTGFHQGLFDVIGDLGDDLKACFIEASFPNSMGDIAAITQHLTPELIKRGLNGVLSPSTRVIIYHIKPKYMEEVVSELPKGYEYIRGGEVITI
ncbi:MAG TPA: 3',5'-cyclic-nucleotide phosphodiesterase [Desulfomonilia bacterium]|nr:3',5'-cyclic-nucleotide phosphodiesterase [Desulfomonilia bacterium]